MSITVAELVALPHLGLEVVAGPAGLERVSSACIRTLLPTGSAGSRP
jgi:hypothetical protein